MPKPKLSFLCKVSLLFLLTACLFLKIPDFEEKKAASFAEKLKVFDTGKADVTTSDFVSQYLKNTLEFDKAKIDEITSADSMGKNIYARFYPQLSRRILLVAGSDSLSDISHMTTKNGSFGIMLEISRLLKSHQPRQFGVDLLFLSAGKSSLSAAFAMNFLDQTYATAKPEMVIIIKRVSHKDVKIRIEKDAYTYSPGLVNHFWKIALQNNYEQFSNEIYDNHDNLAYAFRQAGYICLTLDDGTDSALQNIDLTSLKIVGQTLTNAIYGD